MKTETAIMTNGIPMCPYCRKPTKRTAGGVSSTCVYYPPVYDAMGNNTNPDRNSFFTSYKCFECNGSYSSTERFGEEVTVTFNEEHPATSEAE